MLVYLHCTNMFWQPILCFYLLTFDIVRHLKIKKWVMSDLNEWEYCKKESCMVLNTFLFQHFIGWASAPASGRGLFRHVLHLTLLAAVVIFLLNDAWKWISIFCDQKRYVMAVRYMHYKQPGCEWERKHHTGLCTSEKGIDSFRLSFMCKMCGEHILSHQLCPTPMSFLTKKPEEIDDYVAIPALTLKTHAYN